ncbi:hypothetical protein WA158_002167 [Blastocystis sp. Blastoise]
MLNLPAQFTPETIDYVISLLKRSQSIETKFTPDEEMEFRNAETHPGFILSLQQISEMSSLQSSIRLLSLICLKNSIERQWRRSGRGELSSSSISNEERTLLKTNLLNQVKVPCESFLFIHQLSAVVSRISRYDWPNDFTELFDVLFDCINSNNIMLQTQAVIMLYSVISEHASKRLPMARKAFYSLSLRLLPSLCIYKISIYGYLPNDASSLSSLLPPLISSLSILLSIYSTIGEDNKRDIESTCKWLTKIYVETSKQALYIYTESYITILNTYIQYLCSIFTSNTPSLYSLNTRALSFLVSTFDLLLPEDEQNSQGNVDPNSYTSIIRNNINTFMTSDQLYLCIHTIVYNILYLSPSILISYVEDPEEFINRNNSDECIQEAISLYKEITKKYPQYIYQYTSSQYEHINELIQSSSIESIQQLDYLYNLISLTPSLYSSLQPFSSFWFPQLISPCFSASTSAILYNNKQYTYLSNILKCRCLQLCVEWKNDITKEIYHQLFEHITSYLQTQDLALQLTCITTINSISSDMNFPKEAFQPYMSNYINSLIQILKSVSYSNIVLSIYESLDKIYTCMKSLGNDTYPTLFANILVLWEKVDEGGNHEHFQFILISLLRKMLCYIQQLDENTISVLLQLIQSVLTLPELTSNISIQEESLQLFKEILNHCITYTSYLHSLYTSLLPSLQTNPPSISIYLDIIERYILLGKDTFMVDYCEITIKNFTVRENSSTLSLYILILLLYPSISTPSFDSFIYSLLIQYNQKTVENSDINDVNSITIIILYLLSKEEQNKQAVSVIQNVTQQNQFNEGDFITHYLSFVLSIFDQSGGGIYGTIRKRLFIKFFIFCFDHYFTQCLPSLHEILDCIDIVYNEEETSTIRINKHKKTLTNEHAKRFSDLYTERYMNLTEWKPYFKSTLSVIYAAYGDETFKQMFSSIDSVFLQ